MVCRVVCEANSTGFNAELGHLLLHRLRLATTILAACYAFVALVSLISPIFVHSGWIDHVITITIALAAAGLAFHLWRKAAPNMNHLRLCEVLFFGVITAHFTYLSIEVYRQPVFQAALAQLSSEAPQRNAVFGLMNKLNVLRWFALITLYGVFIPNTARRCTTITAAWAFVPILISGIAAVHFELATAYWMHVLPFEVLFLGLALVIAGFGSYRIHALQKQAFESKQLGQYRLKTRLGQGGMGEVYLAEHLLLKRPCVVKLIRAEKANDPTNQARFEREVQATAGLTHWNTVQIFDYGHTQEGTFYYVMEYLPGLSLAEIVAESGPMPAGRAVFLLKQVCAALHEAHAAGLIHRDIKPSNILVCPLGGQFDVVKLLDFGLVLHPEWEQADSKLTHEGFIVGTPDYLSPEQAQGLDTVDARGDVYSLGATAFYMLTGQPPFIKATAMQTVIAHVREPVRPPRSIRPEIPADLEEIILRCLEKQPDQRFPSVKALAEALAGCSAANAWNEEEAQAWWQSHGRGGAADQYNTPTLVTATAT